MPYRNRYNYRRSRRRSLGTVVQSFKKVINHAGASRAAATNIILACSTGVDSVAAGQSGPTDVQVPTGSLIKYIEFQMSFYNGTNAAVFVHLTIQRIHEGQTPISPLLVGGDPQRNQVFHQDLFNIGQLQNVNRKYRFKVPKKYQRVREGDKWQLVYQGDVVHSSVGQFIYKFYR